MADRSGPPNLRPLVQRPANQAQGSLLARIWAFILGLLSIILGTRKPADNAQETPSQNESATLDPSEIRRLRMARFQTLEIQSPIEEPKQRPETPTAAPSSAPAPTEKNRTNLSSSRSSPAPSAPVAASSSPSPPNPMPSQPKQEAKPSLTPVICRLLNVSLPGSPAPSSRSLTASASSSGSSAPVSIEFDVSDRPNGLELMDVDSLLFAVQEKLSQPAPFLDYLLLVYGNVLRYYSAQLQPSMLRSVQTQFFLLLQQEPQLGETLVNKIAESAVGGSEYADSRSGLTIVEYEELLIQSTAQLSLAELQECFTTSISRLVSHLTRPGVDVSEMTSAMRVMQVFFSTPNLRAVLRAHPWWNVTPNALPNSMLPAKFVHTILGAILNISCTCAPIRGFPREMGQQVTQSTVNEVRSAINSAQTHLSLVRALIRRMISLLVSEEVGLEAFLTWLKAHFIDSSAVRPNALHYSLQWGTNVELQRLDGFYLNLTDVLLYLQSSTLKGPEQSRRAFLSSLAPSYFHSNKIGLKFTDASKLLNFEDVSTNSEPQTPSQNLAASQTASTALSSPSLRSDLFFFTWYFIETTYLPVTDHFQQIYQQLGKLAQQLAVLERAPPSPQARQQVQTIKQFMHDLMQKLYSVFFSIQDLGPDTLAFFDFTAEWCLWLGLERGVPATPALRENVKLLPSFVVESMLKYLTWRTTMKIPLLDPPMFTGVSDTTMEFLITVFSNPHVTNYHILSHSVNFFASLFAPLDDAKKALVVPNHRTISRLVLPLINYYVGVEKTGSRAAFYEKFPIRRAIASILRTPAAQDTLIELSTSTETFMPFMMVQLNDNLFLLDETLGKLKRIRELQQLVAPPANGGQAPQNPEDAQRMTEYRQELEQALGQLKALSTFGNDSFLLFEALSAVSTKSLIQRAVHAIHKSAPLSASASSSSAASSSHGSSTSSSSSLASVQLPVMLEDQILDQLSVMMNYFLDHFASPTKRKALFLKESAPNEDSAMAFNPRQILSCMILTYLNVSQMCLLMGAIRRDGSASFDPLKFHKLIVLESRSYNISVFEAALAIVLNRNIVFEPTAIGSLRVNWKGKRAESNVAESELAFEDALVARLPPLELGDIRNFIVQEFQTFIGDLRRVEDQVRDEDIPESEIPDQFLDELLATLMRDPVRLPSGHIVDRSTIVRQLSGHDKSDPFTRLPMTLEQATPEESLKSEIEAWLKERKAKKKKSAEVAPIKPSEEDFEDL